MNTSEYKPYVCNVCWIVEEMKLHKQRYEINKSYQCECGFSCATVSELRPHKRKLIFQRKFLYCEICGAFFRPKTSTAPFA